MQKSPRPSYPVFGKQRRNVNISIILGSQFFAAAYFVTLDSLPRPPVVLWLNYNLPLHDLDGIIAAAHHVKFRGTRKCEDIFQEEDVVPATSIHLEYYAQFVL